MDAEFDWDAGDMELIGEQEGRSEVLLGDSLVDRLVKLARKVQATRIDERTMVFEGDDRDWQRLVDVVVESSLEEVLNAADFLLSCGEVERVETIGHAIVAACWRIEGVY